MHIHSKQAPNRKSFASLSEIAAQCYKDLVNEFGSRADAVPSPWVALAQSS